MTWVWKHFLKKLKLKKTDVVIECQICHARHHNYNPNELNKCVWCHQILRNNLPR